MTTTESRLESILFLLNDEIFRAFLYNGISKALREKVQTPQFTAARTVFIGSYYACLRECLLTLSKLILPHQESLSIPYLINYVEQNPVELANASPQEVRILTATARKKIEELAPLASKLQLIRDGDLAHIDKRHISDPKSIIPIPIDFKELDACLNQLLHILNDYMRRYKSTTMVFPDFYQLAQQELSIVLSSIKH